MNYVPQALPTGLQPRPAWREPVCPEPQVCSSTCSPSHHKRHLGRALPKAGSSDRIENASSPCFCFDPQLPPAPHLSSLPKSPGPPVLPAPPAHIVTGGTQTLEGGRAAPRGQTCSGPGQQLQALSEARPSPEPWPPRFRVLDLEAATQQSLRSPGPQGTQPFHMNAMALVLQEGLVLWASRQLQSQDA